MTTFTLINNLIMQNKHTISWLLNIVFHNWASLFYDNKLITIWNIRKWEDPALSAHILRVLHDSNR